MNIGRPIQFNIEEALEAAMSLYWQRGYEATSLQALIKTMGLSKSSFYQAFKSKRELFLSCVKHYGQLEFDKCQQLYINAESGKCFLQNLLHDVVKETSGPNARRGCLVINTATEFSQSDPEIAKLVSKNIGKIMGLLETAVIQAQQQGDVSPDKDSKALATYLFSSWSGMRNMVKAGADPKTIKDIADITLSVVE